MRLSPTGYDSLNVECVKVSNLIWLRREYIHENKSRHSPLSSNKIVAHFEEPLTWVTIPLKLFVVSRKTKVNTELTNKF